MIFNYWHYLLVGEQFCVANSPFSIRGGTCKIIFLKAGFGTYHSLIDLPGIWDLNEGESVLQHLPAMNPEVAGVAAQSLQIQVSGLQEQLEEDPAGGLFVKKV